MTSSGRSVQEILDALQERAKELSCLYAVDDLIHRKGRSMEEILQGVIEVLPTGWQYPSACRPRITYLGRTVQPDDFKVTPWVQHADLVVDNEVIGAVEGDDRNAVLQIAKDRPIVHRLPAFLSAGLNPAGGRAAAPLPRG